MVAQIFSSKLSSIVGSLAAAVFAIGATPAAAEGNDQAGRVLTQVASTAQVASQAPLKGGDDEFRDLFSSWKSLDDGLGQVSDNPHARISVPSLMPVEVAAMTSGFGLRNHPVLKRRLNHKGVDLAAPSGTPVYATADGLVSMAQRFSSYGNYIQIEHGAEMQTRYAHLSSYIVSPGDQVHKGELIGYVGSTGRSTGPHLHYEVRVNGDAVNPIPYMTPADASGQLALVQAEGGQGGPE